MSPIMKRSSWPPVRSDTRRPWVWIVLTLPAAAGSVRSAHSGTERPLFQCQSSSRPGRDTPSVQPSQDIIKGFLQEDLLSVSPLQPRLPKRRFLQPYTERPSSVTCSYSKPHVPVILNVPVWTPHRRLSKTNGLTTMRNPWWEQTHTQPHT